MEWCCSHIRPQASLGIVEVAGTPFGEHAVLGTAYPLGRVRLLVNPSGGGSNTLLDHPIFARPGIALTTTSGVHAVAVAEYAITQSRGPRRRLLRAPAPG